MSVKLTTKQLNAFDQSIPALGSDSSNSAGSVVQAIASQVDATICPGTGLNGTAAPLGGKYVVYTTNPSADTADTVSHSLGKTPTGYLVAGSQKGGIPYNGGSIVAGKETGAASPSTDISAGSATTFKIAVDGDVSATPTYQSVTLTLTGLTSGAAIASAMQTAIRALSGIYAAVTVTFTSSVYVVTSGTTGSASKVRVAAGATNDVAATLKIGAANGAVDIDGTSSIVAASSTTITLKCHVASDSILLIVF